MTYYIAKTKEESRALINRLGLNSVPELFIGKSCLKEIKEFFDNNQANLYVIRHADKTSAHYAYVKSFEEFLKVRDDFSENIIVAVSINAYREKVLLGAIQTNGNIIRICATTNKKLDHRTMYNGEAEFNFETNIFDKRLNDIPAIDFLLGYIQSNKLQDLTVEFTIYDRPVGRNNEKILINEARSY